MSTYTGNMIVLGRDPGGEHYLRCACGEEFIYAPGSINRCTLKGRATAVCPKCRTLWDENATPRITPPRHFFALFLQINGETELTLFGVGRASSAGEFALKVIANLDAKSYTGLNITKITEDVYQELVDCARAAKLSATLMKFFGGLDDSTD